MMSAEGTCVVASTLISPLAPRPVARQRFAGMEATVWPTETGHTCILQPPRQTEAMILRAVSWRRWPRWESSACRATTRSSMKR
ncbi:protein of unknown function [Aminobacter niigataensis]|nr:protein of unknown function [Aminobacter niigataensis]